MGFPLQDTNQDDFFVGRVSAGLFLVLGASLLLIVLDLVLHRELLLPLLALHGSLAAVCAVGWRMLRRSDANAALATRTAVTAIATTYVVTGTRGWLTHDAVSPLMLAAVLPAVTAALFPWTSRAQTAVVALSAAAAGIDLLLLGRDLAARVYPVAIVGILWSASLMLHRELTRIRAHAQRQHRERERAENEKAALLAILREASGTVDLSELLEKAQRRTAELLPCDRVLTIYWDPERNAFRLMSQHGMSAEVLSRMEQATLRPSGALADELRAGHSIAINERRDNQWVPLSVLEGFDIHRIVVTPLVVHGLLLGAFVAIRDPGSPAFAEADILLLEGIARHVAVAIGTAERYGAQQEEAEVSAALARVGREMISSLSTPALLDRLGRTTAELLAAPRSCTWMQREEGADFAAIAGHGFPRVAWERLLNRSIPEPELAASLTPLEQDDVTHGAPRRVLALIAATDGDDEDAGAPGDCLLIAIRRAGHLAGVHCVARDDTMPPFARREERIARGVSQIASLALENTVLVEELERANQIKADFVATMSHELRTPLNVISGYNDLLLDEEFGPVSAEQKDILARMAHNTSELHDLINATLTMGRMETGQLPIDLCEVDPNELLRRLEEEIRNRGVRPGLELLWERSSPLPPMITDPMKLKVILQNLISNALKFTSEGNVSVRAESAIDGLRIEIRDTGIGIARELREAIFEPFRQAEAALSRRFGGVGLGLYITRRLVEMLGGRIDLESELGRGSIFRVWIPNTDDHSDKTVDPPRNGGETSTAREKHDLDAPAQPPSPDVVFENVGADSGAGQEPR